MVRYLKNAAVNTSAPTVTGGQAHGVVGQVSPQPITTCQTSTWPPAPEQFNQAFHNTLKEIFHQTMLGELRNVVGDIQAANAGLPFPLAHRGHVVAVSYMCALDAISSYGYANRKRVAKFIRNHFSADYKPHADRIYPDYRLSLVHEWNLFGNVALLPGNEPIQVQNGRLQFGLLSFMEAFENAVDDFLSKLGTDSKLQARALYRYREVTGELKPSKRDQVNRNFIAGTVGFVIGIATALAIEALLRGR